MSDRHVSESTILVLRGIAPLVYGEDPGVPACDPTATGPCITVAIRNLRPGPSCPRCFALEREARGQVLH